MFYNHPFNIARQHLFSSGVNRAAQYSILRIAYMIKILIVLAFIIILTSLGSALFHLMNQKDQAHSQKTAKALTVRIGLSLILFIFIFIAFKSGIIEPHGLGVNIQKARIARDAQQ